MTQFLVPYFNVLPFSNSMFTHCNRVKIFEGGRLVRRAIVAVPSLVALTPIPTDVPSKPSPTPTPIVRWFNMPTNPIKLTAAAKISFGLELKTHNCQQAAAYAIGRKGKKEKRYEN